MAEMEIAEMVEMEENIGKSSLTRYMEEVSHIEPISENEIKELGKMLKQDSTREYALNRLIEGNLKLVVKVAHSWRGKGLSIEDLVAEGNTALITAANNFDIDCGNSFATYAMWQIRVALSRAINKSHTVRIPVASEMKKRAYSRFVEDFKRKYSREPNEEEIKKGLGISDIEFKNLLKLENSCVSMNAKFDDSDSESDEIGDVLSKNMETKSILDEIVKKEEIQALYEAVEKLDDREKTVIKMRFGLEGYSATLDEVANKIGRTRERVRQIERDACIKLKRIMLESYK